MTPPVGARAAVGGALAGVAVAATLASLLALAFAFGGGGAGWLDWRFAVGTLLNAAAPALAGAALLAGAGAVATSAATRARAGIVAGALGVLVGGAVLAGLAVRHAALARAALQEPPVHEVATDWREPLMPTAALLRRRGPRALPIEAAPALPEGPGAGVLGRLVAEVNARTCPQAAPVRLPLSPPAAYARLRSAVGQGGLAVVTDLPGAGVLEAEAPAPLAYGGRADLLARVRRDGQGSRIDLRSVSRDGAVDGGTNCRRVSALATRLAAG